MQQKIKKPILCSLKEMASICGITPRRVQQLAVQGYLIKSKEGRGQYDLKQSMTVYIDFLTTQLNDKIIINTDGEQRETFAVARARKISAEADLAEMQAQEKSGDLILVEDVEAGIIKIFAEIKNNLLNNLPTRIFARIKSEKKGSAIKKIIKAEISNQLVGLSEQNISSLLESDE